MGAGPLETPVEGPEQTRKGGQGCVRPVSPNPQIRSVLSSSLRRIQEAWESLLMERLPQARGHHGLGEKHCPGTQHGPWHVAGAQ